MSNQQTINQVRQLYTRHIALIASAIMNSVIGGISLVSGHLPDWTQYIEVNILPTIAFFADFINARIKESQTQGSGVALSNVLTQLSTLSTRFSNLETAVRNFPTK